MNPHNDEISIIGVDIGGTKILAGKVCNNNIVNQRRTDVPKMGSKEEVLKSLCDTIDYVFDSSISGIGIGVPSIVDIEKGIVYDVQNIPSWEEVHLKELLEEKYKVPVYVNNDANCFALGELHFGEGQGYKSIVSLNIGTGLGAGIIIDGRLYNGSNCGAGEFGMVPYLEHNIEYYSSGQFFKNVHNTTGEKVHEGAITGNPESLALFEELGSHLGNAIKTILFTYDPELIIIGGSVSKAYSYIEKSLWESINQLEYKSVIDNITIKLSNNPHIAVLGAAALCIDNTRSL